MGEMWLRFDYDEYTRMRGKTITIAYNAKEEARKASNRRWNRGPISVDTTGLQPSRTDYGASK